MVCGFFPVGRRRAGHGPTIPIGRTERCRFYVVVSAFLLPRTAEVTDVHIRPMNKV